VTHFDFDRFDALTFDCYGTLIDWEAGISGGLGTLLAPYSVTVGREALLEAYAREEAAIEAGPYVLYREVLARAARGVAAGLGVTPTDDELAAFGGSVGAWPAFEDSADALRRLGERFRLGVITNCDDDLFAASNRRLGVTFDWIVTAQQVGAYKPNLRNFETALGRIDVPRDRILHVAQSLFHDHVPARSIGLATAWIDRRRDRAGFGATPPAEAVPDIVAPDMRSFADLALGGAARPAGARP
jgi:2-haloacid dehalogenase